MNKNVLWRSVKIVIGSRKVIDYADCCFWKHKSKDTSKKFKSHNIVNTIKIKFVFLLTVCILLEHSAPLVLRGITQT